MEQGAALDSKLGRLDPRSAADRLRDMDDAGRIHFWNQAAREKS